MSMNTPTPLPPRNCPSAEARKIIQSKSRFFTSEDLTINYGTVILDRKAAKILLVYDRPNGTYQLPRGPGTGNDSLLATAIQEARDDTGYNVSPLNVKWPKGQSGDQPVACIHRMAKQAVKMNIIFYFAGEATASTRQLWTPFPERKHETYWFGYQEGMDKLCYVDETEVIETVLALLR